MFYIHSARSLSLCLSRSLPSLRIAFNGGSAPSRSQRGGGWLQGCGSETECHLPTGSACSGCAYGRMGRTRAWAFRGQPGDPSRRSPCTGRRRVVPQRWTASSTACIHRLKEQGPKLDSKIHYIIWVNLSRKKMVNISPDNRRYHLLCSPAVGPWPELRMAVAVKLRRRAYDRSWAIFTDS